MKRDISLFIKDILEAVEKIEDCRILEEINNGRYVA
jgi:uncharacterized protein with HEPN domain